MVCKNRYVERVHRDESRYSSPGLIDLLGLERFALWPWTVLEVCSLPCVSSSMSRDMVDLAPAESMVAGWLTDDVCGVGVLVIKKVKFRPHLGGNGL